MILERIKRAIWGDLHGDDIKKFGLLSVVLMLILGVYWMMRPLKDGIFFKMVGKQYQPLAKLLTLALMIPLILFYSKLVDLLEKQKVFYLIAGIYTILFLAFAYFLSHPTIGVANAVPEKGRLLGWAIYLSIESFGSFMVPLFWSFVISSTDTETAKKGYPLIIMAAQIGTITGPTLTSYAPYFGIPLLAIMIAGGIFLVPLIVKYFITLYPQAAEKKSDVSSQKKTGMFEGLKLLASKPYLLGVLAIATLYEVVGTLVDYQMKYLADEVYTTSEQMTQFLSRFGQVTNIMAFAFAIVGTSFFMRRYGMTFCLVMYPLLTAVAVFNTWAFPSLWVVFGAMVAIKGLSYALNNPVKEMMYLPTSKDVKFKAKGWIDGFGGRSAKGTGSVFNWIFSDSTQMLIFWGPLMAFGIIGVWLVAALYVGKKNKELVSSGTIIE